MKPSLLLLFFFMVNAYGASTPERLTVVTENLRPYQFIAENNEPAGYGVEVVKALLKEANLTATLNFYPWARSYNLASKRKNVLIFSLSRTPQRENEFIWIGELLKERHFFFGKTSPNEQDITIEHLKKFAIGVNKSSPNQEFLVNAGFSNISAVDDVDLVFRQLHANRVDFVLIAEGAYLAQDKFNNPNFASVKRIAEVPSLANKLYIAMNKKSDPQLVKRLSDAFKNLQKYGVILKLKQKWKIE